METKYGSEHPQIEKTGGFLQNYTNFSAFGFAVVVSNLPGILKEALESIRVRNIFGKAEDLIEVPLPQGSCCSVVHKMCCL